MLDVKGVMDDEDLGAIAHQIEIERQAAEVS
jgi:hypothetical protein